MSREIRRVPPRWEHPVVQVGRWSGMADAFKPMRSESLAEAQADWDSETEKWAAGTHPSLQYYGPSDRDEALGERPSEADGEYVLYRPWDPSEATWWQLWQTVSEGTPVTPPFATHEELVDYLVEKGDDSYGPMSDRPDCSEGGWTRRQAEAVVREGWVPTGVSDGTSVVTHPGDIAALRGDVE